MFVKNCKCVIWNFWKMLNVFYEKYGIKMFWIFVRLEYWLFILFINVLFIFFFIVLYVLFEIKYILLRCLGFI